MNLSIAANDKVVIKILYQDDDLLVVDKPARLPTQPGKGHERDTLPTGLSARFGPQLQTLGPPPPFPLLPRLARHTSGVLIVGLRPRAYDGLRRQFEQRQIRKFYWAIASRTPKKSASVIRRPILEETDDKKTARISSGGKPAVTAYRVLQVAQAAGQHGALLECRPVTGRLHQVRLHLESIGCPILGDDVYAPKSAAGASPRLALHAHRIAFAHPITGAAVDVRSPWPKDLAGVLKRLGMTRPESVVQSAHEVGGDAVGEQEA